METLHGVVATAAARVTASLALSDETKTLSFGEVESRATAFAEQLVERGVGVGDIVALLLPRSADAVVAMLGVMKAGAAYLPIDRELPASRIRYMLEDSAARALVSADGSSPAGAEVAPVVLSFAEAPARPHGKSALPDVSPSDLAYVIYTSGSTGLPKGVCIEHRTITAFSREQGGAKSVENGARHSQFASLSFDAHVWEIWPALAGGASVHFVPDAVRTDADACIEWLASERIECAFFPTPVGEELLRAEWPACVLETLSLGGDMMHGVPARPYPFSIVNVYGPTECTCVATTATVVPGDDRPCIGRPLAGVRVYVLGDDLQPVRDGDVGELYIGGALVGRGYLRRPELTAASFRPDPFASDPDARMYRTGDLGRRRPDGSFECVGRIDFQVKIRGHRIELGEIETKLAAMTGVRDAVVVAREDTPGDKRLVAYVVAENGAIEIGALKAELRRVLPEYMVPSAFVALESLPLTTNGKVDRRALPAPDLSICEAAYVAPRDALEESLAGIFRDVLRLERVGIDDDFFALGGHSLRATQVVSRVRAELAIELPVRALFDAPTVAALADLARAATASEAPAPFVRVDRSRPSPVSFAQARLWFLDQMDPGSATYNVATAYRLEGTLDHAALERSLQALVARHEALRTTFVSIEGVPHQVIHPSVDIPLRRIEASSEDDARAHVSREVHAAFDLKRGPVLRTTLVRIDATTHLLVLAMHHIATDGWSMEVLVRELAVLYRALVAGEPPSLAPVSVEYVDFSAWQRSSLARGDTLGKQLAFWKDHLAGAPAALDLPTDRPRPSTKQYRGGNVPFALAPELADRLYAFCRREGATPFMVLLAAYQMLLARWSGELDVVVGTPIANRTRRELESMVGFFVNTLPMRTSLRGGGVTFREVVSRVKRASLAAYANQDVPFEKLVEELRITRDTSRTPIFQVMFAMQNTFQETRALGDLDVRVATADVDVAKFDLTLVTSEREGRLHGVLEYDVALFDHATIVRFSSHFVVLLDAALTAPETNVASLPLMTEGERARIRAFASGEPLRGSSLETAAVRFEAVAARTPDAVALRAAGRTLTYAELDARANQLARLLRQRGVGRGARVVTLFERSIEMVVALLATLKAGAAYVPADPTYPAERIAHMIADSGAALALTTRALAEAAGLRAALRIDEPAIVEALAAQPSTRLPVITSMRDEAYVIFTSGTTGKPKGTIIAHEQLAALVAWHVAAFEVMPSDRAAQIAGPAFDATVWELWPYLLTGASVGIPDEPTRLSPEHLRDWFVAEQTTIAFAATPLAEQLLTLDWPETTALRTLLTGGDRLSRRPRSGLPFTLVNNYGPTECTVVSSSGVVLPEGSSSASPTIGRPIHGSQNHVLDDRLEPLPIGIAAQLWVGGASVGSGYADRPALTAERFSPDPFSTTPGARMYATGDLVRWLEGGELEYLGRIDHQVKIRGFRIELGEIESVLGACDNVREAVVVACGRESADKRLVAYVAARAGTLDVDATRSALAAKLPPYMVPSAFVALAALPLTPNGKVDRKALPEPDLAASSADYVAPRDATEVALAVIFRDVLRVERVGIHDDFFALGGHSLRATQVMARIRSALGVELPVRALFEASTVARLAEPVRAAKAAIALPPLVRVDRSAPIPASFSQARLWFLDQMDPGAATYNVPLLLGLEGTLDAGALERALEALVARHEALRTTFVDVAGEPRQVIHPPSGLPLRRIDVRSEEELRARVSEEIHDPLDLTNGPIARVTLFRRSEAEHLLVLCIHHIATDGWSMEHLVSELASLYRSFSTGAPSSLPEARFDYADFAVWQRSWLDGEVLARQLAYWKDHLAGAPAALEMPTDRPRPPMKQYRGRNVPLALSPELVDRLRAFCRRESATPFMVLLAAYQVLLSRWSGQRDVVVGAPIANRTRQELEGIVGFFVNTLPLRTSLEGDPSFGEAVQRVKRTALGAYAHQDVPFEKLVDSLRVIRDTSRGPVFQAMFQLQNVAPGALALGDVTIRRPPPSFEVAKFDLTLAFMEEPNGFPGEVKYDVALFDRATIERFASHFLVLLDAALAAPETSVAKLPLMGEAERRRVLVEWNATHYATTGPRTIHGLFEAQVDRMPDAPAVQCGGTTLSYAELDARANRIAHGLRARGVSRGARVGVEMGRSVDMLAAMLGVMKAGAGYLPIDPQLPDDRRAFMKGDGAAVVTLDDALLASDHLSGDDSRPREPVAPEDLAYVLYTSGSTGRPKGTMVSHANVANLLASMMRVPGISAEDTTLSLTTISFDVSVAELFLPLVAGAKVVIATREETRDPLLVAAVIDATGARQFGATPATWRMMVDSGWRPRAGMEIHCAGEALPRDLADALLENGAALWNLYGPTEATVYASGVEVRPGERITIGRPLDNTQLYVLDRYGAPVPIGVLGELYIGGAGVALGYLGRPELTAEKFVPDPFASEPGARMYRTGDVVRWLPDQNLEYFGRVDHQVKIRGFRIELGEIEAALAGAAGVASSVVLAREDVPGDKRLVAYVVAEAGSDVGEGALKTALAATLPSYMLPSAFVFLPALPLNSNGKVDRKALPAPNLASGSEYVAPRTPTEHVLAEIFREVLRLDRVGVHDDFFALGGHSLLATRVMTRIRERLGASVPVRTIFEAPTIAGLAPRIDRVKAGNTGPRLERVAERERSPVSYNQRFWWRRQEDRPDSPGYKYLAAYRFGGSLDESVFARSLDEVIRRHDSLRTNFEVVGGEPFQVVHPPRAGALAVVDLTGAPAGTLDEWLVAENQRAPELRDGPSFPRFTLLRVARGDRLLVITGHRATLDPLLCANVMAELSAIYGAFVEGAPSPLAEPAFQYVDFIAWQRKVTETPEVQKRLAEARARLAGATPLALPVDREQPAVYTTATHRSSVAMNERTWGAIRELARAEATTQFVVLSAALKTFLARLANESDVTIVAPNELARGLDGGLSSVLGCFHDYFVLRTDLSGGPSLREAIRREHLVVLASQRDVDVPSALVTDDYVNNPLWRVALNFVPASPENGEKPAPSALAYAQVPTPRHRMVDLAWAIFGTTAGLFGAADLFDATTVTRIAADLGDFLTKALAAPDAPQPR